MKKIIAAALLLLTGCSSFLQPTPTPVPTATFTATPLPTATPTLTPTPTPTAVPPTGTPDAASALQPQGKPASEWQGIPIMPGAITGEGDEEGYVFSIKATPQEIQQYYQEELPKLGWQLLSAGEGKNETLILIFTKGASDIVSVSILVKGDQSLVLLVK